MGKWRVIFDGTVEDRPIKVEVYDEGDFRVRIRQGTDEPGTVKTDGSSTIIMPPTAAGRPIDIEGSPDEIRSQLISEGFSEAAADEIVQKFLP